SSPSGNPTAGDGTRLSGLGAAGPMTWGVGRQTAEVSPGCVATVSPTKVLLPSVAGGGIITVQTSPGCNWNASALDPWIMTSVPGMAGTGNVVLWASDASGNRAGRITVAGVSITVLQHIWAGVAFANGKGPFQRDPGDGTISDDACEYVECVGTWSAD